MKMRKIVIVIFLLLLATQGVWAGEEITVAREMEAFSFSELFKGFPELIENVQVYFYGIAFIIFSYVLVRLLKEAKDLQGQVAAIVKVMLGIAIMVSCKQFINLGLSFNEGLSKALGSDYYSTAEKLHSLSYCFYAADFSLGTEEIPAKDASEQEEVNEGGLEDQMARTGFWSGMGVNLVRFLGN